MTTVERPYWPHSDPEPPAPLSGSGSGWVATPPQTCLGGCQRGSSDARDPVTCQPGMHLCSGGKHSCLKRLDTWLREIPDNFGRLLWVKDHGTVAADPGTKTTKRPDPPAPMRLEVIDLLDVRAERGVLGIVHSWAELVRDQRHEARPCTCSHARPGHAHRCSAIGCGCQQYRPVDPTVTRECAYLITNLAWCGGQDWAGDLYDEIRILHRTLADTVGEYRPKPVGTCARIVDRVFPTQTEHVDVVCGGALVMDKPKPDDEDQRTSVHCLRCGQRHEANEGLRELGLIVDSMFRHNRHQEAS